MAATLLGAGALVTYDRVTAPELPAPPVISASIRGVSATVTLPEQSFTDAPLRLRLNFSLTLADGGDSGAPSAPDAVRLLDIVGKGFQVRLPQGAFPMTLGPPARTAQTYDLQLNVVVSDCATGFLEPRRLDVQVQRPGQEPASVPAEVSPEAIRALDRLVGTTCRRPRG